MAINGLGSFDMMSRYNRISVNDQAVSSVKPVNTKPAEESVAVNEKPAEENKPELKVNLNLEGMRRRSGYNREDISKDFSRREAFSLSGIDENFMNSEIQKAVSTMEKDQSLQQFQYFVGDSNILVDDADGIVIRK